MNGNDGSMYAIILIVCLCAIILFVRWYNSEVDELSSLSDDEIERRKAAGDLPKNWEFPSK